MKLTQAACNDYDDLVCGLSNEALLYLMGRLHDRYQTQMRAFIPQWDTLSAEDQQKYWLHSADVAVEPKDKADELDDEPFCYTCISSAFWVDCEYCEDGMVEEFDDDLSQYTYEFCDTCHGNGGWWVCLGSEQHDLEFGSIHRIPIELRERHP